jgi:tetratricopeptide (TPR) repeat protein
LGFLGSFEEAEAFIEKALRNVLETGALVGLGISEFYYGTLFLKKGAGKLAIEHYQNSIRYFEEVENFYLTGLALSCLANGYHLLGDLETTQKHVEKGLEI